MDNKFYFGFNTAEERKKRRKAELYSMSEQVSTFFWDEAPQQGLEMREGQQDMSFEIVDALINDQHFAIEAGVGIGKSFGYLVPVLLYSKRMNKPVIIATSTIALQEQLWRDVHTVMPLLGLNRDVILAKGQTHYLCNKRADAYMCDPKADPPDALKEGIQQGYEERKDFPEVLPQGVWDKVNVQRFSMKNCGSCEKKCKYYKVRAALVFHILNGERRIGHFRHFLDLKVEKAERVIVKAVVDIIEDELATLIDNDASRLIAVGIMLHQVKAVTADLVLVNGVPRPDVTGNCKSGGVGVHLKVLLLGGFLLLLFLRDHGDRHNLIAQLCKLFRNLEMVRELLHLLYAQRTEAVLRQAHHKECTGKNVVDVTVFIPQSAVQRQTSQFAFIIADQGNRFFVGIDCLNVTTHLMLQGLETRFKFLHIRLFSRLNDENGKGAVTLGVFP